MDYIAPRDITVVSTCGRSVILKKGVPTYCPPQMHKDLISMGVVPAQELPEPALSDGPGEPVTQDDREQALFAAFEKIILRGRREDFSATGVPHSAVLAQQLGWGSISVKERDTTWVKFNLDRAGV